MNACGHHHVGNIGILGVDKNGAEWYQVSIGGDQGEHASLGKVIGPSFAAREMPDVVTRLIDTYIERRRTRRAVHRHRSPHRHRAVQGARLCRCSLRTGAVVEDRWTLLPDTATPSDVGTSPTIVPLALWLAFRDALAARNDIGVWLKPADDPDALAGDVGASAADRGRVSASSATGAAIRVRDCCGKSTASGVSCARSARSCAISSIICGNAASIPSRWHRDATSTKRWPRSAISATSTRRRSRSRCRYSGAA